MDREKTLTASLEDYLEAIYQLARENKAARAKEISKRLGVNRSSVTGALHALSQRKLVNYAPYDIATLTPEGERVAANISHRHLILILDRLAQFVDFIQVCPRLDINWIEETGYFCERPDSLESCERCITTCLHNLKGKIQEYGKTAD
jgi:DtxR family transcriptional regulator, Mn-dependent transcriptional regulator